MKKLLVVIAIFLASCGGDKEKPFKCPEGRAQTSAKGVCIATSGLTQIDRSDNGPVVLEVEVTDPEIRQKIGDRVVAGINTTILASQYHNPSWTRKANSAEYIVFFTQATATNMDGTPALRVGGIQSAGTVINVGFRDNIERFGAFIVVPIPIDWNLPGYWDYLEASIRHEAEHDREWHNDKNIFWAFVGPNDQHPHWTLPPTPVGFVQKTVSCPLGQAEGADAYELKY